MIEVAIFTSVFYVLLVIGMHLAIEDFLRVGRYPILIIKVMIGQIALVPFVAIVIATVIPLDPAIAGGMLLIAAAPIGAMSNYYVALARGDAALSVTLSGVSSLLAVVTTPVTCWFVGSYFVSWSADTLASLTILQHTAFGLLLPIVVGMLIRWRFSNLTARISEVLQRSSLVAVAILITLIVTAQYDQLTTVVVGSAIVMSLLFTTLLTMLGWIVARLTTGMNDQTRGVALMFGFPARNFGLAALLAANAFGRIELAAFGAAFFIIQFIVLIPMALISRRPVIAS